MAAKKAVETEEIPEDVMTDQERQIYDLEAKVRDLEEEVKHYAQAYVKLHNRVFKTTQEEQNYANEVMELAQARVEKTGKKFLRHLQQPNQPQQE